MVRDGKGRELLIDFSALPISQNKGLKPLSDHGVKTPTLLRRETLSNYYCPILIGHGFGDFVPQLVAWT